MPAHPKYHHFLKTIEPDQLYAAITIVSASEDNGQLAIWAEQQGIESKKARQRLLNALNTFRSRNIQDEPDGKLQVHHRQVPAWYGARWRLIAECDELEVREQLQQQLTQLTQSEVAADAGEVEPQTPSINVATFSLEPDIKKACEGHTSQQKPEKKNRYFISSKHIRLVLTSSLLIILSLIMFLADDKRTYSNSTRNHSHPEIDYINHFDLAWTEYQKGNFNNSSALLIEIFNNSDHQLLLASSHYLMGAVKQKTNRYSSSVRHFETASAIYLSEGKLEDKIKSDMLILRASTYLENKKLEDKTKRSLLESFHTLESSIDDITSENLSALKGMFAWVQGEIALRNLDISKFIKQSETAITFFQSAGQHDALLKSTLLLVYAKINANEKLDLSQYRTTIEAAVATTENSPTLSQDYHELANYLNDLINGLNPSREKLDHLMALHSNDVYLDINSLIKQQREDFHGSN